MAERDPVGERGGKNLMGYGDNLPSTLVDRLGLACCGDQYYFPLLFGCCDIGSVKHVYSRVTDCCVEGEAVYGRLERWDVKICFSDMGLGPFPHAWVESGDIARGYYFDDTQKLPPYRGIVRDENDGIYPHREPGFSIFGDKKICIPVTLRKCSYDISKFNNCLSNADLRSLYTIIPIPYPSWLPYPLKHSLYTIGDNCWSGALKIVKKCAKEAKR